MPHFPKKICLWSCVCLVLCGGITGCGTIRQDPPAATPPPTFTGPRYLHGTVGSMAKLRGYEPLLVSGFGLIVNLKGTGSSDVPEFLRRRLLNDMARKGMGNVRLNAKQWSPKRTLASRNTAIVAVHGLIPPGATRNTPFDIWVTALPQTQTTSLANGRLFTTDLAIDGTNPAIGFSRPMANGYGQTYVSPLLEGDSSQLKYKHLRTAMILSGGKVTRDRKLQLILNQPSWSRSRRIAHRITEAFGAGRTDRNDTAVAQTDLLIDLHIPSRFSRNTEKFLSLIQHLYVQGGVDFEPLQAAELVKIAKAYPNQLHRIVLAWKALGRTALPPIRQLYDHRDLNIRLAALDAGTYLGDGLAVDPLIKLASFEKPDIRKRVGVLLVEHPRNAAAGTLIKRMLSDSDPSVATAIYEALAEKRDPLFIQRKPMGRGSNFKFMLDIVEAQQPRVFITQGQTPRIAIFNSYSGFKLPMVASLWEGQLLLKALTADQPLEVYYRPSVVDDAPAQEGLTFRIAPTIANLIFLMAHKPTLYNTTDGLNLSYTQVVDALHQLSKQGKLQNKLIFQENPLATRIAKARSSETHMLRPETAKNGSEETSRGASGGTSGGTSGGDRNDWEDQSPNQPIPSSPQGRPGMGAIPLP